MEENIKVLAGEVFFSSSLSFGFYLVSWDHWLAVTISENLQAEKFWPETK